MTVPGGTYRLQIREEFGFDDAAAITGYLRDLGVTHAYLSPILAATPGSAHGYDAVAHDRLSDDAGGEPAFRRLAAALLRHGLGAIADVVPNHMAVPTPVRLNVPFWSVLAEGPDSEYAAWFDVDRTDGRLLMPVLGRPLGEVLEAGELTLDRSGAEPVLRYFAHEFPIRAGTEHRPLPELLAAQYYRLAWWRVGPDELNYRRFFDVTTLAAIRVEEPEVFEASHRLLLDLLADGALAGLRIDHPDGLADPRGYLRRLSEASGGVWVVVEKILEDGERLPADWPCAGTTGYDALNLISGVFVDPDGEQPLTALLAELDAGDPACGDLDAQIHAAKHQIIEHSLAAELRRLVRLLVRIGAARPALADHTERALYRALSELLASMDRYRAYVVPGEPPPAESVAVLDHAVALAARHLDEQAVAALHAVRDLALDTATTDPDARDFLIRFQQTCGPVMAKGIEDTLFYRRHLLVALNEVGADPHRFARPVPEFHELVRQQLRDWPDTMTTLSTHDTKRSEDARARLLAIAEVPQDWAAAVRSWWQLARPHRDTAPTRDPAAEYLFWQTLVATWGISGAPEPDRIVDYLLKAAREAKTRTTWTAPDPAYEAAIEAFARAVLDDPALVAAIGGFVARLAPADRAIVLGQKLVQLTMPGVPDLYQGTELVDRSLVDPDNRRPVDYARRRALLARLDTGEAPSEFAPGDRLDAEKLLVTSRALRLRRDHPEWFGAGSTYRPLTATSDRLLGFTRGAGTGDGNDDGLGEQVAVLATRFASRPEPDGGWGSHTVPLPAGRWRDLLTGGERDGGDVRLGDLLADLPVSLLVRPQTVG